MAGETSDEMGFGSFAISDEPTRQESTTAPVAKTRSVKNRSVTKPTEEKPLLKPVVDSADVAARALEIAKGIGPAKAETPKAAIDQPGFKTDLTNMGIGAAGLAALLGTAYAVKKVFSNGTSTTPTSTTPTAPTAPTTPVNPQTLLPQQPVDLNAKIEAAKQANAARAVENAPINRGTEQPVSQWADEVPKTPAVPPTAPAAAIAPPAPPTPPTPTTPSDPRSAFLQKAQEIQGQAVVPPAGGARRNPAQLAEFKVEEPLNKGVNQLVYSSGANKPNVPETEFRDFRNAAIDEVYGGQPPASQGGSVKNQKQLTNWIETNKERFPNVWNNYQAIKDKFPTQGGSASLGMLLNLVGLSGLAVEGVKASKSGDWSNFGLGAVNQAVSNIAPRASLPTALMTYSKSAGETPEELKALGERLKYAQKVGYGRGSQGVPPP